MTTPEPTPAIRDAANNAVAVASIAYQQEVIALTTVLACAARHGLTVADLCAAGGFDQEFVERLLREAS